MLKHKRMLYTTDEYCPYHRSHDLAAIIADLDGARYRLDVDLHRSERWVDRVTNDGC